MNDKIKYRKLLSSLSSYDGLYVIERHASEAFANRYVRSARCKRMYALIYEQVREHSLDITVNEITDSIRLANEREPFGDSELSNIADCVSLVVIRLLGNGAALASEPRNVLLQKAIRLLQSCELYDFEAFKTEISAVEQILSASDVHSYSICCDESKAAIRRRVVVYAKRHGISESAAAMIISKEGIDTGSRGYGIAFFALWGALSVALLVFTSVISYGAALFALLPICASALLVSNVIIARLCAKNTFPILRLNGTAVPEDSPTLVVITTVLRGKKADDGLFRMLEKHYLQNRNGNIRFGILADLSDSKSYSNSNDAATIENAVSNIRELNERHQSRFCLFIRSRSPSASEKVYMGSERKRGALLALARLTKNRETGFSHVICDSEFLSSVKYILTLDSDTQLYSGAVCDFVMAMLHPDNRPVVKDGQVVKGFGVMAPRIQTSLSSACASPFSVLLTGAGGIDNYPGACFELYSFAFGHSAYCGKGIFDVNTFLEVLDGVFPKESVLSHDLLEGSILRCGFLCSVALTDSCPSNPASWFAREHRWIRGDTQLIPFICGPVPDEKSVKRKNKSDPLSRFMMADNIRRILTPVAAVISLAVALVFEIFDLREISAVLILSALSYIWLPPLFSLFTSVDRVNRRFYSHVLVSIWHSFALAVWNTVSLFHFALLSLDAFMRALWRMYVSRSHLLEWKTSSVTDKNKSSLFSYIRTMLLSVVAGILLLAAAPRGFFSLLGLLFILCPFVARLLSAEYRTETLPSEAHKRKLKRYARDAWSYFEHFVTEADNFLPPDNYQELPVESVAHRTSPTNIAMYLLSCIAAADFGFIGEAEMSERIRRTVSTVDRLQKYRGQLYNWYDTESLEVIGAPYVSSVDSGNFFAALLIVADTLGECRETDNKETIDTIKRISQNMDFSLLYNKSRRLFSIGFDTVRCEQSPNCYDLLMSEARTLSYIEIARGNIGCEHWRALGRPLTSSSGHIGIASWSGTAFEYFMPALFMPIYENSLMYESLGFALFEQARDTVSRLWGRSESGYFAFDEEMNYQYRAFGAETLALDISSSTQDVIAPYASFLTLCMSDSMSLDNLARLEAFGMYGRYGFYEACDFTRSRVGGGHAVIASWMSHHVGMIIISSANYCFEGIFRKRFMSDPQMGSCSFLLEERIPVDAPVRDLSSRPQAPGIKLRALSIPLRQQEEKPDRPCSAAMLSNGQSKLFAQSDGSFAFFVGDNALSYPFFNNGLRMPRLYFSADGAVFSALGGNFGYSDTLVRYEKSFDNIKAKTDLTLYGEGAAFCIEMTLSGSFTDICPVLAFEPVMTDKKTYSSHPTYSALTISCEYSDENGLLIFRRRGRGENERDLYMSVSLECSGGFEFCCRRDELLPLMYCEKDLETLALTEFPSRDGACIQPFAAVNKSSKCEHGKYSCRFLVCSAESKSSLLSQVIKIRSESGKRTGEFFARSLGRVSQTHLSSSGFNANMTRYCSLILSCSLLKTFKPNSDTRADIGEIWRFGISNDLPIICLYLENSADEAAQRIIFSFATTVMYLKAKGFYCDLVIICKEGDGYTQGVKNTVRSALPQNYSHGRRGGIIVTSDTESKNVFACASVIYYELTNETVFENIAAAYAEKLIPGKRNVTTSIIGHGRLDGDVVLRSAADGAFLENAFQIIKGKQKNPWSYVYASPQFGTVLTQNSLGFTYFRNSQQFRLTEWDPDPLLDLSGEVLTLSLDDGIYNLAACSHTVRFTRGYAEYEGEIGQMCYKLRVGCAEKFPVKLVCLEIENKAGDDINIRLDYSVKCALGQFHDPTAFESVSNGTRFFRRCIGSGMQMKYGMYLTSGGLADCVGKNSKLRCFWLLGAVRIDYDEAFYRIKDTFDSYERIMKEFADCYRKNKERYTPFKLKGTKEMGAYFNYYAPWQAEIVRLYARSGFWQSGGAYGFRDQLQDAVSLLPIDTRPAIRQIFRCAAHQYTSGDVMHWWHDNGAGVRTMCSDDALWLVWAVCEYVDFTCDRTILTSKVGYVESAPLPDRVTERYEIPSKTEHRESIYYHCARAIDHALSRIGVNGLCLIGSCDWNDGFSAIGKAGKGESVWLSIFLSMLLKRFSVIACDFGYPSVSEHYRDAARSLDGAVENTWDGDHYLRAFDDSHNPVGAGKNKECAIDIIPQAFAAMNYKRTPKTLTALATAMRSLYFENKKMLLLFTPPATTRKLGNIGSYVPGIRENGGQYTHAAVWAAIGLFEVGKREDAINILKSICPTDYPRGYRCEPYMLAGDVYNAEGMEGRGGWSGYTGAAGWYYRACLEICNGYKYDRSKLESGIFTKTQLQTDK